MKKFVMVALLLLAPSVYAQLDWSITDLRCGNGKLDQFELCEKGMELNDTLCDELGSLLKVDTVCDTQHCTCLPRVNKAYCGNDIREGVELCDGSGADMCPEYGNLTNLSLSCDPAKCGCKLNETLPSDYNPVVVETLTNISGKASVCGDKKVERAEDCDPPNTLCTTNTQEPGVCTEKCRCVKPELLDVEDEFIVSNKESSSDESNETSNVSSDVVAGNETDNEAGPAEETSERVVEGPGFFAKLWAWIASLFS